MNSSSAFNHSRKWWAAPLLVFGLCGGIAGSAQPVEDLQTAKRLLAAGSLDDAIVALRRVVAANPRDADALQSLGTALALVPKPTESLEYLRRAVVLRPAFLPGHLTLGMALARFGELEDARQSYEKVLALDPAHVEAHVKLAMVLAVLGRTQEAIEHLSLAIHRQGNSPEAALSFYLRGKAYSQQERLDQAAKDFERAVQLRPDYAKAYLELGIARAGLQDDQPAMAALRRAVELAPNDAEAHLQFGSACLRTGDASAAVEHLRIAAKLRPDDRQTLYALVRALRAVGRADEAAPLMEQISRSVQNQALHDPDVVRAGELNNQGVALEKEGKFAEALEKYRAAVAISPRQVEFQRNLALALCRLDRWTEAIVELKAVLAAVPGDVDATKALYLATEKAKEPR